LHSDCKSTQATKHNMKYIENESTIVHLQLEGANVDENRPEHTFTPRIVS
jgi:hypothetical protein